MGLCKWGKRFETKETEKQVHNITPHYQSLLTAPLGSMLFGATRPPSSSRIIGCRCISYTCSYAETYSHTCRCAPACLHTISCAGSQAQVESYVRTCLVMYTYTQSCMYSQVHRPALQANTLAQTHTCTVRWMQEYRCVQ
ncbi:hypothetical protein KIL84_020560 [Mauremys mutica]|uniref:Uncharacterized protein n=1 Tax=Mauremys mutica TaxID=74926 RepID=A0A9D3XWY8_9SAUR|nr:hypothetical protein KIL84_020560 [Mauremys mutica]